MRGVTVIQRLQIADNSAFQLTRLMRGVTVHDLGNVLVLHISTHTPHARRDEN